MVTNSILCKKCGNYFSTENDTVPPHTCISGNSEIDVKNQKHYTQFKIQPVEFIMANKLNYCQGHAIKYICRYKEKDGKKDLLKAKNFIDYLIQELETGEVKP